MKLNKKLIAGLVLILNANIVLADNYIGMSVGKSDVDVSGYDDPTAFKVFGGLRAKNFGIEGAYHNLGDFKASSIFGDVKVAVKGFEVSGVAFLPLNETVELFGKVGIFSYDYKGSISSFALSTSDSGTELTYGAGAQFNVVKDFAIRAEYQKFTKITDSDVSTISIGAAYNF